MKKYILSLVCLSVIAFPALISAEEDSVQNQVPGGLRKDVREIKRNARSDVKEERQ